jgi:type IX secretion system substrate protein
MCKLLRESANNHYFKPVNFPMETNPNKGFLQSALKTICISVLTLIVFNSSFSQSISGVVNSYYQVIQVIPAKACVRLNTVAGLSTLNKVMIVQMKGATVDQTNSSAFGDTFSLNNAGNYELAVICAIDGDSVFMFHNFLNNYTVTDKVQLVKFAEYSSATVIDTVKAAPWNNATGTGGVIAISVATDLTLNAPIYADASGFHGGAYVQDNGVCSNFAPANGYIYNASSTTPQNGAYKGESVYDITVAGQTGGRGAPANGGGGGNNHNNGGGGGANLTNGGLGGGNSSTTGCTTTLRGLAGKALSNWGGKKIFFGGGGGAGHSNGSLTVSNGGGNGGGIIFIHASNVIGNSKTISANGDVGGGAYSDGASGGGAGGTIIMDVTTYSGTLTINANGGAGGNELDDGIAQRCYGAGGGGGGGSMYFTGSVPGVAKFDTGGIAGTEINRNSATCNAAQFPLDGIDGTITGSYVIRQSTDSAAYCKSLSALPVGLIFFRASIVTQNVALNWKIANADMMKTFIVEKWLYDHWIVLQSINADGQLLDYNFIDQKPVSGKNLYRLRMIEKDNSISYSPLRYVTFKTEDDKYIIFPNPARDQITITTEHAPIRHIKISTITGKTCVEKNFVGNLNSVTLELQQLPSGIYALQINDVVKKLIIQPK